MSAAATGCGGEPPEEPPKDSGMTKKLSSLYDWKDTCDNLNPGSHRGTSSCKCRDCTPDYNAGKPIRYVNPHVYGSPRYSYIGFLNARRAAFARRSEEQQATLMAIKEKEIMAEKMKEAMEATAAAASSSAAPKGEASETKVRRKNAKKSGVQKKRRQRKH